MKKKPTCWILAFSLLLTACLRASASPTGLSTAVPTPSPSASPTATIVWFPATPTRTRFPTSTPLPPTPEMRPGLGAIILQDDFNSGEAWTLSSTAKGNVALSKNKLTIAISTPKSYVSSLRSQPIVSDFYAEITASPNLCRGTDEYGLLIRAASEQDYYRFSVSCDGQTRLDRVYQGTPSSPQPWMLGSRVPIGSPSTSRLAVWAMGKEMRFFINDEYQFTVRDPLLPSGRLGVFARSAGDSAVTVNFSDLVVRGVGTAVGMATPIATPTITPKSTLTPSPLPTLAPTEAQAQILDLLQNNAGCRLPCWWGFTPGITRWEEARRFLETFAKIIDYPGPQPDKIYNHEIVIPVAGTIVT